MRISPGFSNFRVLLDQWDEYCECENTVAKLLDGNRLIMFLKRGEELFGAPEESRLVFAKMKSSDDDEDSISDEWRREAKFVVLDLLKSLAGEPKQVMLGADDLDKLQVVQRDDAAEALIKLLKR